MELVLPDTETNQPTTFVDSTELLDNPAALRQRAAEDGYLYFKRFLPREEILSLRTDMIAVVGKYGWRQKDQDPTGGLIDLEALNQVPEDMMRTDIGVSTAAYGDVQCLERFHRLPHHPYLIFLYQKLFGKDVLVHPRHIARMITSHKTVFPTPPHQDFPLIQGTANTWTCWIRITKNG